MDLSRRSLLLAGVALLAGCGGDGSPAPPIGGNPPQSPLPPPPPPPPPPVPVPPPAPVQVRVPFSFAANLDGFTTDFADYSPGMEIGDRGIVFASELRRLPPPLDNRFGLLLGGSNRSDDLFMFIWREVSGLVPGQRYRVETEVLIATNAPAGCAGIGGPPGEAVAIKAGASPVRPAKSLNMFNKVVVNFEKDAGPLTVGGNQVFTIGNFAGGAGTCTQPIYALKTLRSPPDRIPTLAADATGRLWLVIGTDSGYEGRSEIYYLEGAATLTPA